MGSGEGKGRIVRRACGAIESGVRWVEMKGVWRKAGELKNEGVLGREEAGSSLCTMGSE